MLGLLPERITFVFTVVLSLTLTRPHFLQRSNPESSTTHLPDAVHEEMFVRIGGIDQWITIKGEDRNNPVILFLHGGPGDAWSPLRE